MLVTLTADPYPRFVDTLKGYWDDHFWSHVSGSLPARWISCKKKTLNSYRKGRREERRDVPLSNQILTSTKGLRDCLLFSFLISSILEWLTVGTLGEDAFTNSELE